MKIIKFPDPKEWNELTKRPVVNQLDLSKVVSDVFDRVREHGDNALLDYTLQFDGVQLETISVSESEWQQAEHQLSAELVQAIQLARTNIEIFHLSQREQKNIIETSKGVSCWRESRPVERIGMYIPGGTAPLFSTVLMLGVPAKIAGCKEMILCTPPDKRGNVHPAVLFAARLVGITAIFKVGGIQAIAALTFGTESIIPVDKIFGPGNQYVTAAKQLALTYNKAIDLPAGPSELLVIADSSADPEFVAADLLSQAEHGPDSQVFLLSDNERIIGLVLQVLEEQVKKLPRKGIAEKALRNSRAILCSSINECIRFSNVYAPEHLILAVEHPNEYVPLISNAGSVFLGRYSCESAGDYASGTNHTLPTNGYARNYSGVSLDSFVKKITFQELSLEGLQNIGPAIELMAEAEELTAHKNAVSIRLKHTTIL